MRAHLWNKIDQLIDRSIRTYHINLQLNERKGEEQCLCVPCVCVRFWFSVWGRKKLRTTLWSNTTIIDFISINLYIFPPAPLCFEYASGAHINISGIQRRKRHSHTITDRHLMTVTTALRKKRVNFSIYRINVSICFFPIDFAQINGFISLCHAMPFLALSLSFAHAHALSRVHLISFAYSDIEFDSTHSQCGRMCIVCVSVCVWFIAFWRTLTFVLILKWLNRQRAKHRVRWSSERAKRALY